MRGTGIRPELFLEVLRCRAVTVGSAAGTEVEVGEVQRGVGAVAEGAQPTIKTDFYD